MLKNKEILEGQEILEIIENGFGLSDYETVMDRLGVMTRNKNFGNREQVSVIKESNFISIKEFFEENDYFQGEAMTTDDFKNELKNFDFEYNHDNTYNYSGYLANEMDFMTLVNCDTSEMIVLFAVHIGLDVRCGYTSYFPIKFDNEYDFFEMIGSSFSVAYIECEIENKKSFISVDCEACSEIARLYIADDDNNWISDLESYVDISDNESLIDNVKEILSENGINFNDDSFKIK